MTRTVGILLILVGVASYILTGRTSATALIPAFFGAAFVLLALLASRETWRPHAMHAAVALGLIGCLGSVARALPAVANGQLTRPAVLAQLLMGVILAVYVAMGVRSFIDARRRRAARG